MTLSTFYPGKWGSIIVYRGLQDFEEHPLWSFCLLWLQVHRGGRACEERAEDDQESPGEGEDSNHRNDGSDVVQCGVSVNRLPQYPPKGPLIPEDSHMYMFMLVSVENEGNRVL